MHRPPPVGEEAAIPGCFKLLKMLLTTDEWARPSKYWKAMMREELARAHTLKTVPNSQMPDSRKTVVVPGP
jgi:hypothetical protein